MPGIWVAVNATTSWVGSSRKTTLKSWKSRPAAPRISTRVRRPRSVTAPPSRRVEERAELRELAVDVGRELERVLGGPAQDRRLLQQRVGLLGEGLPGSGPDRALEEDRRRRQPGVAPAGGIPPP